MFMSDVYLDKMIDKFIHDMENPAKEEKETYLVDVNNKDFTFKEIGKG